jgi:hypothetical protein
MRGPHGYIIQPLGVTERAAVNKEYEEMLARLCDIKKRGLIAYGAPLHGSFQARHLHGSHEGDGISEV